MHTEQESVPLYLTTRVLAQRGVMHPQENLETGLSHDLHHTGCLVQTEHDIRIAEVGDVSRCVCIMFVFELLENFFIPGERNGHPCNFVY